MHLIVAAGVVTARRVFLLAHDDAGRLVVQDRASSAGLAGATLIDLLLSRSGGGRRRPPRRDRPVRHRRRGPDATTRPRSAPTPRPCGPRAWVSWISHGAYAPGRRRPGRRAASSGGPRRAGSACVPAEPVPPGRTDDLVRVRSRVRYALHCAGACPIRPPPRCAAWSGCCGWSPRLLLQHADLGPAARAGAGDRRTTSSPSARSPTRSRPSSPPPPTADTRAHRDGDRAGYDCGMTGAILLLSGPC